MARALDADDLSIAPVKVDWAREPKKPGRCRSSDTSSPVTAPQGEPRFLEHRSPPVQPIGSFRPSATGWPSELQRNAILTASPKPASRRPARLSAGRSNAATTRRLAAKLDTSARLRGECLQDAGPSHRSPSVRRPAGTFDRHVKPRYRSAQCRVASTKSAFALVDSAQPGGL